MKFDKFCKNLIFIMPLMFLLACHSKRRPQPIPSSCVATIQYSTCSPTSGCTLSFSCLQTAQMHTQTTAQKLFEKIISFHGVTTESINFIPALKIGVSDPTMTISMLTINSPALLQATAGVAPSNWYNNSISCSVNGSNVTCLQFFPIASNFTIQGTLGDANVTVDVTVEDNVTSVMSCGEAICGQAGTTVQRMFDCSQRVTNFAGFGNGNGTFTAFVPGNPNPNWFLVSSPSDTDTQQQQCFWLSPVMTNTNPAAGTNEFDSNAIPISTYANSSITKGRFLWSGLSTNAGTGYTFFQANGNDPRNSAGNPDSSYDYYEYTSDSTMATLIGPIYRPESSSSPTINSSYYTGWNDISYAQSLCKLMTFTDLTLLSESVYQWQMPSYPMMMTLTGGGESGSPGYCETNGTGLNAFCNGGGELLGFRAIDPVPNFLNTYFWTSSPGASTASWFFNDGYLSGGDLYGPGQVRCVSATW